MALRAADLQTPLARLLHAPRYEVIPVRGIEDKVAALAARRHGDRHRLPEPRVRADLAGERTPGRRRVRRGAAPLGAHDRRPGGAGRRRGTPACGRRLRGLHRRRRRLAARRRLLRCRAAPRRARRAARAVLARRRGRLPGRAPVDLRRHAARGAAAQAGARRLRGHADLLRRRRPGGVDRGDAWPRAHAAGGRGAAGGGRQEEARRDLPADRGRGVGPLSHEARSPGGPARAPPYLRPHAAGERCGGAARQVRPRTSPASTSSRSTRWRRRERGWRPPRPDVPQGVHAPGGRRRRRLPVAVPIQCGWDRTGRRGRDDAGRRHAGVRSGADLEPGAPAPAPHARARGLGHGGAGRLGGRPRRAGRRHRVGRRRPDRGGPHRSAQRAPPAVHRRSAPALHAGASGSSSCCCSTPGS